MNNIKSKVLIYDFIISIFFLTLVGVIGKMLEAINIYNGLIIVVIYILGFIISIVLCYLNNSKNKKESNPKWYDFHNLYEVIVIVIIVFIIIPIALMYLLPEGRGNFNIVKIIGHRT